MNMRHHFIVASRAARNDPADRTEIEPCPPSVVPVTDGLTGLGSLSMAWLLVMWLRPPLLLATWLVLVATALPMMLRELARSPALPRRSSADRPLLWLAGFVVATVPMLFVHGQGGGLLAWLVAWTVVLPAFALRLAAEHRRNGSLTADGLPLAIGRALFFADWVGLKATAGPARLWFLKAFFIPVYAASLFALLSAALKNDLQGPLAWLTLAVIFAYTIDLAFALSGYVFASNALVPTVKSTQPRLSGWIVCLLCYAPVCEHWGDFKRVVNGEIGWPTSLTQDAGVIAAAVLMIVPLALYVSATVVFGLRFSNLSNRGVISSGPYRYMKHPAYFAHVGNSWIITFVFLPAAGATLTASQMLVPVAFTILYRYRAVTEEMHMREDAGYAAYCDWIARHGLVGRLRYLLHRKVLERQPLVVG
jgi:protein-S-isoprenylcysteine O-methyltransferase Ste14